MSPGPLSSILNENKLNGDNFKDWKRNLNIVLCCEKHKFVLEKKCPPEPTPGPNQVEEYIPYQRWIDSNEIAKCYILGSISADLQRQHENYPTATSIMENLEDMFGGQELLARQTAITNLMNCKQVVGTPVKSHMLRMMGYFSEAAENGGDIEYNVQIEMIFNSLSKDFVGFRAGYSLGNKEYSVTQLMKELRAYELMLYDGKPLKEANVAAANLPIRDRKRGKPKQKKQKASASVVRPKRKAMKKKKKPQNPAKAKCFYCGNKGHFKRDCQKFQAEKGKEGVQANEKPRR